MFLSLLSFAMGCQDDTPSYLTEVGDKAIVVSSKPICRGDTDRILRGIDHVESVLDVSVDEPISIVLHDRLPLPGCIEGATGCFVDGEVQALWQAVDHEIVHAIAYPLGQDTSFWNEGIAVALSGRTRRGGVGVAEDLELSAGEGLDYLTAGHFTRWLLEQYGNEGIRRIARGDGFLDAYAIGLDEAIGDYEETAPWSYPSWSPCWATPLAPIGEDEYLADVQVDCSAVDSTARLSAGVGAVRTIHIEQDGVYRLLLHGGSNVWMMACQLEILDEEPLDDLAGDIKTEESGSVLPTAFVSEVEHELRLEQGDILLRFATKEGTTEELLRFDLARIGP